MLIISVCKLLLMMCIRTHCMYYTTYWATMGSNYFWSRTWIFKQLFDKILVCHRIENDTSEKFLEKILKIQNSIAISETIWAHCAVCTTQYQISMWNNSQRSTLHTTINQKSPLDPVRTVNQNWEFQLEIGI